MHLRQTALLCMSWGYRYLNDDDDHPIVCIRLDELMEIVFIQNCRMGHL